MSKLEDLVDAVYDADVLVIGSEGAGASAALEAHRQGAKVIVVSKGYVGRSGVTCCAGTGIVCDSKTLHELGISNADPKDSPDILFEDTVRGGKHLNNQNLVEAFVKDESEGVKKLMGYGASVGVKFDRAYSMSTHSYPRTIMDRGPKCALALRNALEKECIETIENTMIIDLLVRNNRVQGALGISKSGEIIVFRAKSVVIATGGVMSIYEYSRGSKDLTGDGWAMAYRANAELVDVEFQQFIPGVVIKPKALNTISLGYMFATSGLMSAWMFNRHGERFMKRWDPNRMEKSTRDVVSIAIMNEILEGRGSKNGGVYVSFRHLPTSLLNYFHEWFEELGQYEIDIDRFLPFEKLKDEGFEVIPSSHFTNGGIKINERCETNIGGLYAAGEVTGGLHGANRLGGNAYTEFLVFGPISGREATQYASKADTPEIDPRQVQALITRVLRPLERKEGVSVISEINKFKKLTYQNLGVLRDGARLGDTINELENIKGKVLPNLCASVKSRIYNDEWWQALEFENMVLVGEMIARAALMRTESRGSHYRKDFPMVDNDTWMRNIVVKKTEQGMELTTQSVIITRPFEGYTFEYNKPLKGKFPYAKGEIQ